ncbi:MAG TPA: branched-chain amino acid ABC transporter permease [Candidatus Acidoferrales bacterium]|nr:branched-chain amino acid ABC transporter permease [Candidatus Acidoferrales bacterium]
MTRRNLGIGALAVLFLASALVPLSGNGYVLSLFYISLLFTGLAYGWNIISGYAGYLSFGQITFFGLGAYVVAIGTTRFHAEWWVCALIGGALCAALAVPMGYLMLRLQGPFFALGMLGLAQSLRIATDTIPFTGGAEGIYLPPGANAVVVYYFTLVVLIFAIGLTAWIDRSAFGLRLRALREDERAAGTLGVDTTSSKVQAFVLSAIVPALLGGGYAWYLTYVEPSSIYSTEIELQTVAMAILGGMGTLWGPLVGGILMSQVSETLSTKFPQTHLMIFGALIVILLIALPRGIVPAIAERFGRKKAVTKAQPQESVT